MISIMDGDPQEKSLKDEYETLLNKAKQFGLELEASRLTSSFNSIRYHASNPDEETRRQTIEQFKKMASELREKISGNGVASFSLSFSCPLEAEMSWRLKVHFFGQDLIFFLSLIKYPFCYFSYSFVKSYK